MISYKKYNKIKNLYWVADYILKKDQDSLHCFSWKFSLNKPNSVPNPSMDWRHPTYIEAEIRQKYFEEDKKYFFNSPIAYGSFDIDRIIADKFEIMNEKYSKYIK
jgi:hypothetical protein